MGQSEIAVADMTDMFVLLLLPDSGDELQGIKRGIIELADLVLVNKADGESKARAERTAAEYANALRLLRPRSASWEVSVRTCSALTGAGVAEVWTLIEQFRHTLGESGELAARRAAQARSWLWDTVSSDLVDAVRADTEVRKRLPEIEQLVIDGILTPATAARRLMEIFLEQGSRNAATRGMHAEDGAQS